MVISKIDKKPIKRNLKDLLEGFGTYIKLVVDIKENIIYGGCKLHIDAEQILLEEGSNQEDIWGGGVDVLSKKIDCTAIINIRPKMGNSSMEILDCDKRRNFIRIVKKYFPDYEI